MLVSHACEQIFGGQSRLRRPVARRDPYVGPGLVVHKLIRFVADTAAYGQTEHLRGLLAALKLKPEVIFLLTDGGEPLLDNSQLRAIREQAAGRTSIHCVQFGRGPAPEGGSFLERLAAENGGSYVYIDMNRRK